MSKEIFLVSFVTIPIVMSSFIVSCEKYTFSSLRYGIGFAIRFNMFNFLFKGVAWPADPYQCYKAMKRHKLFTQDFYYYQEDSMFRFVRRYHRYTSYCHVDIYHDPELMDQKFI